MKTALTTWKNYNRIKAETKQIVANELQRIADAPDLCHLLPKKEE